ncbi:hypothetical protein SDC9_184352 [bioreactor metagenome]|uniref:Uncharacterized protein n=1 Tax=bioreactor metagenome TaxID=1076179 RepID=A0A645HDN8_9ZZZZ
MAEASILVPPANCGSSNTPTGPFQTMVPALATISASLTALFGPTSRMRSWALTSSMQILLARARAETSSATTTSVGSGTSAPRAFMMSMIACASLTRSGSASDSPMRLPEASRKVLAMPPPTINWSTLSASERRMVSLDETLEPPTIATSGRFGSCSALDRASISAPISTPAQATGAYLAMPWVVASARWAVPKASLT